MLAMKHQDVRIISKMTLADLIDRYTKEIGAVKPFGKNKKAVLAALQIQLGETVLPALTVDRLTRFIQDRRKAGAGGVTISIDLTYLGSVLKAVKNLWRLPVDPTVTSAARDNLRYLGLSPKSNERERRPTKAELDLLYILRWDQTPKSADGGSDQICDYDYDCYACWRNHKAKMGGPQRGAPHHHHP